VAVTSTLVAPVIPSTTGRDRGPGSRPHSTAPARRLPVPHLPERREGTAIYGLATLDHRGRIADLGTVRAMGWSSRTRLDIRELGGLLLVTASPQGVSGAVRLHRRRPRVLRRVLRLLQPRPPASRDRAAHPGIGPLRHCGEDPRRTRQGPRRRLRGQPGPVPPPTHTTTHSWRGVDQPTTSDRTDIVSNPCLIKLDSFRSPSARASASATRSSAPSTAYAQASLACSTATAARQPEVAGPARGGRGSRLRAAGCGPGR
jgi:hypothetical protein